MTVLIACDLDGTLIYSRRSAGMDVDQLTCVEHRDGAPAAFMTGAAARALEEVGRRAVLVPVTTRTEAQLARVRLPARIDYAIAANGGRILREGVVDSGWSREIARRLRDVAAFDAARERSIRLAAAVGGRRHEVDALFVFVVLAELAPDAGDAQRRADALAIEAEWARANGWRLSVQHRKVYWVPSVLTKSAAVCEVARRSAASTVLAAGDSLLDADLFEVADRAIRPAHGELAAADLQLANLSVTRATGARAGEEIVAWFAERTGSVADGGAARPTAPAAAQH